MNFMASRRGFHEDGGSKGTCSSFSLPCSSSSPSSSSSTCSIQRGFVVSFTHNHQPKPGWFDNGNEDQEDDNGPIRGYPAGGVSEQPDQFMMDSSSPTNPGGSGGGDESSDGQGGGGGLGVGLGIGRSSGNTEIQVIEREHMFDKVVTPSDVGKLNRLVIPKQHAEKYFPLDSSANEKGLLLNFEDRNGKPWRFRYSYWNSSQSYVMTKGWSRFVKEKKLDAGDIVSFQRGVGEFAKDRLFIDWRRRPDAPELPRSLPAFSLPNHFSFRPGNHHHHHHHPFLLPPVQARESHLHLLQANAISPHQTHLINSGYSFGHTSNHHYGSSAAGSVFYLKPASGGMGQQAGVGVVQLQRAGGVGGGGGGGVGSVGVEGMPVHHHHPMVFESVPVVQGKAAAKRLRLFGVNMECPISESDECDILSSTTVPHSTIAPHPPHLSSSSYPPLPLRPYSATDVLNKGKASMSLDLDI